MMMDGLIALGGVSGKGLNGYHMAISFIVMDC